MTTKKSPSANGKSHATRPNVDPIYDLPLLGPFMKEADTLRAKLQGENLTRKEAELLRMEARALRHLANYLETRAVQLERLSRDPGGDAPRVTRIQVEK